MNRNNSLYRMVMAALLCAVGIVIPMFSPVKIFIPPAASYTLASHVPIFIAMFISPATTVAVALGTTLGFFLAGFPLPVYLRAFSHLVFAIAGAYWLKKHPETIYNKKESILFCLIIGIIHGAGEVLVLMPLYFGGNLSASVYQSGFFYYIVLLIGVGTMVHSSVDYVLSVLIWRVLRQVGGMKAIASVQ